MRKEKLINLPLGTRFHFGPGSGQRTFVLLSHGDTIAEWNGNEGPVAGQFVGCAFKTREEFEEYDVWVIE